MTDYEIEMETKIWEAVLTYLSHIMHPHEEFQPLIELLKNTAKERGIDLETIQKNWLTELKD